MPACPHPPLTISGRRIIVNERVVKAVGKQEKGNKWTYLRGRFWKVEEGDKCEL